MQFNLHVFGANTLSAPKSYHIITFVCVCVCVFVFSGFLLPVQALIKLPPGQLLLPLSHQHNPRTDCVQVHLMLSFIMFLSVVIWLWWSPLLDCDYKHPCCVYSLLWCTVEVSLVKLGPVKSPTINMQMYFIWPPGIVLCPAESRWANAITRAKICLWFKEIKLGKNYS